MITVRKDDVIRVGGTVWFWHRPLKRYVRGRVAEFAFTRPGPGSMMNLCTPVALVGYDDGSPDAAWIPVEGLYPFDPEAPA